MITSVHVLTRAERRPLTEPDDPAAPTLIPAATIVLELEGSDLPPFALLDSAPVPLVTDPGRTRAHVVVDLSRSVGFHLLDLSGKRYVFGTEDAKLRMAGIQQMLDYLYEEGLSWGFQLFFADGVAIRHPKVDYAWLVDKGQRIAMVAAEIAGRPSLRPERVLRVCEPGSRRVLTAETRRLIRRNRASLLEAHPAGPIRVKTLNYFPRAVVAAQLRESFDTAENRRLTWLLRECLRLATHLVEDTPGSARAAVVRVSEACDAALRLLPFARLAPTSLRFSERPTTVERGDPRYSEAYQLYEQFSRSLGWEPSLQLASRFAYVRYADQIYQAFVAIMLADMLGTRLTEPALRPDLNVPAFSSTQYEIYYDTVPPVRYFRNWRDASGRRADKRPDFTIVDVRNRKVLLVDAKYRVELNGLPPTQALDDCQVYMHGFQTPAIGVCYPGPRLEVTPVSAQGYTILQIALSPSLNLRSYLAEVVRPSLLSLMQDLPV